ncbi:MAG: DUF2911 domain-containing protein, partial [Saprospiraceae bacterium]|nr:DUF2911 domain-containing protein [Saprospiraceae bacterium]
SPAPSPAATVQQTVGLTDFTIEYSRPGKKDREIMGGLVPYGQKWRAGANAATKLTCSTECTIGGAKLSAGSYAMLITPDKDKWTLHFYPYQESRWTSYRDSDVKPVNATSSEIIEMPWDVETFAITFNNLRNESATLHFIWERVNVVVPVTVPAAK